jgi:hypothetical protein
MQYVYLKLADNGVIKTIEDDNINAAGESFESTTVYEFDTPDKRIKFIEELSVDIGLEFGNSKSKNQIQISTGWGDHYKPTPDEIKEKIKTLELEIQSLEQFKNG